MSAVDEIERSETEDAPGEELPVGSYALLTSIFALLFGAGLAALGRSRRGFPEIGAGDLALFGVATHKLSRTVTKDKVTRFARAPFTRYEEPAGHGELEERPRGSGLRRAVGDLLVCPYCVAQWISAAFLVAFGFAPRAARFVAGVYAVETASDVLQLAYKAAEDRASS